MSPAPDELAGCPNGRGQKVATGRRLGERVIKPGLYPPLSMQASLKLLADLP